MLQYIRSTVTGITLCLLVFISPSLAAMLPDFVHLSKTAGKAVVNISTEKKISGGGLPGFPSEMFQGLPPGFEQFFQQFGGMTGRQAQPRMQRSLGTGFIISEDGYIVTNNHVVANADVVRVNLEGMNGKEQAIAATIVGTDPDTDLALLKVNAKKALPYLEFGDSDKAEVGEWLLAIGNPFGLGHTVTQGILSAKGRDIQSGPYDNFLQTDASINPGNSGGPLINMEGRVIGINTAIIASGQGIGFAIPSNMAKRIVEQLKSDKKVTRGWLGVTIQEVDVNTANALGLGKPRGALIGSVIENEPAAKAGVQAGDVILAVNGEQVNDSAELLRNIAIQKPGSTVRLTIWRDGSEKMISVKLGERGAKGGGSASDKATPTLGLSVRPLTAEEAASADLAPGKGLLIVQITPGGPAAEADLKQGDILLSANRKPLRTAKDLSNAVAAASNRGAVMLQVLRRGQTFFRSLPLPSGENR